jgi:Ca2+-binding EF-hand superfamily protein
MNYEVNQTDRLQHNVEFELSRLLEKEIHFHIKSEIEKKELEAADDFSTVAVFTCMDALNYGYLDFDQLRNYYAKFKGEVLKEDINAMMRRMSNSLDAKITFREFSVAITPELSGLGSSAETVEFHTE